MDKTESAVIRLSNLTSFVELYLQMEHDPLIPASDARVAVQVQSGGYAGHSNAWVDGEALDRFCRDLITLERTLRGEATLESLSPGKLSLRIFAANSRGMLAVAGGISLQVLGDSQGFKHALEFGFEFEPTQLTNALRLPWVARHCA